MARNPSSLLIVEDTAAVRAMIVAFASSDPDLKVVAVGDLESALRELDGWVYDVVMLDLLLPDVHADHPTEGILAIRARCPLIAIVVVSGVADKKDMCLAAGADAFIEKPKLLAEMLSSIRLAFDKRNLTDQTNHIVGQTAIT